jgi:quercetin dioxygenase-like cupin family protein
VDAVIDLERIPWQELAPGARAKIREVGRQRVRLVEFTEGFEEPEWCTAAHAGQVVKGTFTLRTPDGDQRLSAGDVLAIPAGVAFAHKAVLGPGEHVLLLLFESV